MDRREIETRMLRALGALQEALNELGPITDEATWTIREPVLGVIEHIHEVGEEIKALDVSEAAESRTVGNGDAGAAQPRLLLHTSWPHGVQKIWLEDDDPNPDDRIYLITDADKEERVNEEYRGIYILGLEMQDLVEFWWQERKRPEGGAATVPGNSASA